VPGDNSVDIFTNDIGVVVITDAAGQLQGYNLLARRPPGGLGRLPLLCFLCVLDPGDVLFSLSPDDAAAALRLPASLSRGTHTHQHTRPRLPFPPPQKVGGGMGRTHRNDETFPRLADPLGYVGKEDIYHAIKAIVATQVGLGGLVSTFVCVFVCLCVCVFVCLCVCVIYRAIKAIVATQVGVLPPARGAWDVGLWAIAYTGCICLYQF
jgi:hypothetical protein